MFGEVDCVGGQTAERKKSTNTFSSCLKRLVKSKVGNKSEGKKYYKKKMFCNYVGISFTNFSFEMLFFYLFRTENWQRGEKK